MSNDLISAAAFLRRRVPKLRKLPVGRQTQKRMMTLVTWHAALKNLCIVKKDDRIEAVGVARQITKEVEARYPYYQVAHGKLLFVENVASRSTEGMRDLLRYVAYHWPQCTHIMFSRSKNGEKNKIHPMKTFLKKAKVL